MQRNYLSPTIPRGADLSTLGAVLPLPPKQLMGLTLTLLRILAELKPVPWAPQATEHPYQAPLKVPVVGTLCRLLLPGEGVNA